MTLRLLRRNALAADLNFRPTIPPRRNQFLELIAGQRSRDELRIDRFGIMMSRSRYLFNCC
jgi:hypothetical protein